MKKIIVVLLIVALVTLTTTIGVLAVFTNSATNVNDNLSTGSVDLAISPTAAIFTVSNMAPGDIEYGGIQVTNNGSLELRYAMTTTVDNTSALDEQLELNIDVVTGAGNDTIWYTADDVVGEVNIYGPDGVLSSAAIGNPAQGADTGDRTLAPLSSERLRFKVRLPLSTNDTYQNDSCTVSFVFDAEQTDNNP